MLPSAALDLFRRQHGLLGMHQARDVLDLADRRRLYRDSDVERLTGRVLRHRAAPECLGSQLLGPVLDAGRDGVLWDESAALWWGFGRDRDPMVHVGRPGRNLDRPLGRIHRLTHIDPVDVVVRDGIPTARPERVILGLAASATRDWKPTRFRHRRDLSEVQVLGPVIARMGPVIDHAWRMGMIDGGFMHEVCERMAGHGQAGIVALREMLRTRPPHYVPSGSGLELRFEDVIGSRSAQLRRQAVRTDEAGFIGRVDYLAKSVPLVIEINSERFHTTLSDRANDDRRYQRLLDSGLSVLVLWEYDVWNRAREVREVVASCLTGGDDAPTLHRPTRAPWELLPERRPA